MHHERMQPTSGEGAIDPVCGMKVDPETAAGSVEHMGTTYYFCSVGCLEDFREDPDAYAGGQGRVPSGGMV